MASMKYCDKHNQVGFLKKPEESSGFAEIVDFLKGSKLRYALTCNPTIHDSLVKQFWQTATALTLANGTLELRATIYTLEYSITEASIRSKLQLADASGISMLPNTEIFEGMGNMGNMKRGFREAPRSLLPAMLSVVAQSAGPEDQSVTQPQPSSSGVQPPSTSPPQVQSSPPITEPTPTPLMSRIDSLEKDLKQTIGDAIVKLVKKVKKLEGVLKRRKVVLSNSEDEETEAQGRKIHDDPLVSLVQELITPSKLLLHAPTERQLDKGRRNIREEKSSISVNTGSGQVSPDKGQREGKAPIIIEETQASKKTKEQILQEEASIVKAIRLDALEKEEKDKQAQVQFEAQHYIEEDWDVIRAKLEANAELSKSVLGSDLQEEDFAKKMVELVNQIKKHFAEERVKARRMKEEFDKLVKQIESFVPIARKGLHTKKTDEDETEKDEASEKDDPTSGTDVPINPVPISMKPPSIANYKIIKQGKKGVYQIVRENGTDKVYISFGAMLKDISRDDLTELYMIVMKRYGMNGPEDEHEKTCRVQCLNLESADIYMLTERSYPISTNVCQAMLDKKRQGIKANDDCYKLLKLMEKQAGIR
ncbi:hypothetical protein Tco_1196892 [Tanacetum coccineum]